VLEVQDSTVSEFYETFLFVRFSHFILLYTKKSERWAYGIFSTLRVHEKIILGFQEAKIISAHHSFYSQNEYTQRVKITSALCMNLPYKKSL